MFPTHSSRTVDQENQFLKHRSSSKMPMNKRSNSSSSNHNSRVSPCDCNTKNTCRNCKNKLQSSSSFDEEKDQWKEARCPICMEHPHNAVLLICSSHEKGCRPYMCDTSYRHSNCFDQFCKMHGLTPSKSTTDDQPNGFLPCENRQVLEFVCPLCRGNISGWIVVQGARTYMNSRIRGCALESCDFSGNYGELRRHARLQHSWARPSEADHERQADLERLEQNNNRQYELMNPYFYHRIHLNFYLNPFRNYRIEIDYVSSYNRNGIMEVGYVITLTEF